MAFADRSPGIGSADGASSAFHGTREYDRFAVPGEKTLRKAIADGSGTDDERRVEVAFLLEHPRAALARKHFSDLFQRLLDEVSGALTEVERAGTAEDRHRQATIRLLSCQNALGVAPAELARLETVFDTWRGATIDHVAEPVDLTIPIRELLEARPADGSWATVGRRMSTLLQKLGVWPVVEDLEPILPGRLFDDSQVSMNGGLRIAPGVILRQPRSVTIAIYQYHVDGRPSPWPFEPYQVPSAPELSGFRLVDRRACLIVDRECRHELVRFHTSLLGRSRARLSLSALGGLRSYATNALNGTETPETAAPALQAPPPLAQGSATIQGLSGPHRVDLPDPELAELAELRSRLAVTTGELALARAEATKAQLLALERLEDEAERPARSVRKRRRAELTA